MKKRQLSVGLLCVALIVTFAAIVVAEQHVHEFYINPENPVSTSNWQSINDQQHMRSMIINYICQCGDTSGEVISEEENHTLNLNLRKDVTSTQTTHTVTVYTWYSCSKCGYKSNEIISSTSTNNHEFSWMISDLGHKYNGTHTYLYGCATCGKTRQVTVTCGGPPCPVYGNSIDAEER